MRCEHCDADFQGKTMRRRFCSAKCRKAAWQTNREHTLARLEENLSHALVQVQSIREGRTRPGAMSTGGRSGSWSKHQSADE
jgi:hypothetical protein